MRRLDATIFKLMPNGEQQRNLRRFIGGSLQKERCAQGDLLRWLCASFLFLLSGAASADCFHDAASFHRVNPLILRAIAIVESGGRPDATNRNRNGSVDYGMMQINSIHLPELARYGIGVNDLYDGCKSVFTGALILRRSIDKYGNTWAAVGSYNSATPYFRDRYAAKVKSVVEFLLTHGYADEAQ